MGIGLKIDTRFRLASHAKIDPIQSVGSSPPSYTTRPVGPPAPVWWSWRAPRKDRLPDKRGAEPVREGAFAALAGLVR